MKKKKRVLLFALIIATGTVLSQENTGFQTSVIKKTYPGKGSKMLELNFKPFSSTDVISFDNLQTKYFLNNQIALRLGLKVQNQNNTMDKSDWDESEEHPQITNEKSTTLSFNPGVEYHFLKNSKISPYAGVELAFSNRNSSSEYEYYTTTSEYNSSTMANETKYVYQKYDIDGAWMGYSTGTYIYNGNTYTYQSLNYTDQRSYKTLGAHLLLGSDFYFVKNMYFGFELGLGYTKTKYEQVKMDITDVVDPTILPSYKSSDLNFYYNNAIRLGIWF
ncbi:MAG: hypothetical protein PHH37_14800 [Paludibacter sp.]|nr:hypothetical protein [Paludibacter sp.]